ncbi:hypothetical protein Vafri_21247 [Volvox africanus]|uniref:Uncharacterized protein n=1 Tax=Volvox africanus TaxID=51714 RepID=A0A8J4FDV7_9CHLO|nr:hypothetical protein Vafri_21247 [Volvox africanus]
MIVIERIIGIYDQVPTSNSEVQRQKIPSSIFMGTNKCLLTMAAAIAMVHLTLLEGTTVRAGILDDWNHNPGDRTSFAAGMEDSADALMSCFNSKFNPNPAPFIDFVNANPSQSFFLHRLWWSKRASTFALSGFTSLDISRLQMLEDQCRSFPGGVIAAAVWQPLIEATPVARDFRGVPQLSPKNAQLLANVTNRLESLFTRMEAAINLSASFGSSGSIASAGLFGSASSSKSPQQQAAATAAACNLRLLLVAELVADEQMAIIMPINAIRNAAFLAVDSPLAAMVDVDLSISAGLAARVLRNQTRAEELVWRSQWEHVAWVLPTFDIHKNVSRLEKNAAVEEALAVPPDQKTTRLRSLWRERHRIHPFAADRYPLGHNATDYDRWFATPYEEYPSSFQEGYEPWFMGPRRAMPPYDVRIRYGTDTLEATPVREFHEAMHSEQR